MKTFLTVLVAGTMWMSTAVASKGDPFAEERYQAKQGRYTPAEESRRYARKHTAEADGMACAEHGCCRHAGHSELATRKTPAHSHPKAGAPQVAVASAASMCEHPACCE